MSRLVIPLALAVVAAIGCGGSSKPTTEPGGGSDDGPARLAKKISLSWGIQQHADDAEVYLAITDETGKVTSHGLGRWQGTCGVTAAAKVMNALTAIGCRYGGTGTELHAVVTGGDAIVVLKLRTDEGVTPDPMAREEVTRIKVPLGVAIEADPIASTSGAP